MGTMIFFFYIYTLVFQFCMFMSAIASEHGLFILPKENKQTKSNKNVLNMYFLGDNDTLQMVGKYI